MKILLLGIRNIGFANFETKQGAKKELSSYVCFQAYN